MTCYNSLTSPLIYTPQLLRDFGTIWGLLVNVTKSVALNISVQTKLLDQLKQHFTFTWAGDIIPYLGMPLCRQLPPMFRSLEADLTKWSKEGLSWLGRLNAVKITLLPHLLYLLSLLLPSLSLLKSLFWINVNPRLLDLSGETGVTDLREISYSDLKLGLPNLWLYYHAAQLA